MEERFSDNDWTGMIVDAALEVHRTLGPGLLEIVYEEALAYELQARGLGVVRQVPISARYKAVTFDIGFKADLLVQGRILIELKSVEKLAPVHKKQLQTYLRLADLRVGLLLNFGAALLKDGIVRVVNGGPDLPNAGRSRAAASPRAASSSAQPGRSDVAGLLPILSGSTPVSEECR